MKQFAEHGAVILGVSPDDPATQKKFEQKHNLAVTLLSDPDKETLKTYGAFGEKKSFGRKSEGVIRSTFLIDPDGVLRKIWSPVRVEEHAEAVLESLRELA